MKKFLAGMLVGITIVLSRDLVTKQTLSPTIDPSGAGQSTPVFSAPNSTEYGQSVSSLAKPPLRTARHQSSSGDLSYERPEVTQKNNKQNMAAEELAKQLLAKENFVKQLWVEPIPRGILIKDEALSDGTYLTTEKTEQLGTILKIYSKGELSLEELRHQDGSYLVRSYYEDGTPKGISYGKSPRENAINFTYSRSGEPTYKLILLDDGNKSITKFSDFGEPVGSWIVTADDR